MTLKLNGSSSGYTAIDAPAAAGSNTLTLPANNGTAGQVLSTDGNGNLTWVTPGLSEADTWRLTANVTGKVDLTSGWERDDTDGNGLLGTGITESSGIFSFPSTGYWLVSCTVQIKINTGDSRYSHHYIKYTSDNGSNWSNSTRSSSNHLDTGDANASFGDTHSEKIFDITDTSNQKIKIHVSGTDTDMISLGDSNANYTYIIFLKLGDT